MSGEGRIINPSNFAKELIEAVESDPGTERKAMLFYVDDEQIRFVRARSEARVMTLEFTRSGLKQVVQAGGDREGKRTVTKMKNEKSTTHRRMCAGRTPGNVLTSYACTRSARKGSDYCYWHDPDTEPERLKRSRSAAEDRRLERESRNSQGH